MIIDFPQSFVYDTGKPRDRAYVRDGILYIEHVRCFENMIYELTYELKGRDTCYYCNKKVKRKKITLDHMFPMIWGGVTLPNNLIPCCKKCNMEKSDMTYNQFIRWKMSECKEVRDAYYKESVEKNRSILRNGQLVLPLSWIRSYDISNLIADVNLSYLNPKTQQEFEEYYNENHGYPVAIIVSGNGKCLKGLHVLYHAQKHGIKYVPAILLDNVVKL